MAVLPQKTGRRVEIGIAVLLVVGLFITLGSWFWALFVVCFLFLGFRELTAMMATMNTKPSSFIVFAMGGLMIVVATMNRPEFLPPLLTVTVIASFFRLLFRQPIGSMSDIAGTLLAVVYLAYLPVHYILLRQLQYAPPLSSWDWSSFASPTMGFFQQQPGLGYLILTVTVVCACDVAAYYTGKQFGRSLLYPEASPKKTREGALGGVLAGLLWGMTVSWLIGFPLQHGICLSVILSVVGQIGDLVESIFKRSAGIKDSGGFLQEHGGLLDRTDSYIFSGVVSYYYIYWIVLDRGLAHDVQHFFQGWFG